MILLLALLQAQTTGTRLLREPTISATQVAFAYANDIWVVGRDGGQARRLTSFPGTESRPAFSPDGKWIAFTASYGGNPDVYVVSADGGEPKRLTWHPCADAVAGWTPDGANVLFFSGRDGVPVGTVRLWKVPVAGGNETPLPVASAGSASLSADGTRLAYQHIVKWQDAWRNYRGGQAQPIWVVNLSDMALTKVPGPVSNNDNPAWVGNTVYFISDRDLARNVWAWDASSNQVRQVTHSKDFDVSTLAAGGGALVYERGGWIYTLDPATGQSKQLDITAAGDFAWDMPRWVDVSKQLSHASLSPTGQRALFEARGEIITVPAAKGDARNISKSSGTADRAPAWSADGKRIAWFSDAGGEYGLMVGDQDGLGEPRRIAIPKATFYYDPQWSPDGKYIAFTDEARNIVVVEIGSGKVTRVDGDTYATPERATVPQWSPDSRYLAYAKRLESQLLAVNIWSVADGRARQVTDGMSDAKSPTWDASGKYLWLLASTDVGPATAWLEMSAYERHVRYSIYAVVLAKNTPSPFLPESDEEKAAPPDSAKAAEKKDAPVTVAIDWDGLGRRIIPVPGVPARTYSSLTAGTTGVLFYTEDVENQPAPTLHRYDLAKRAAKPLLSMAASYSVSRDGKKLLYQSTDGWSIVPTEQDVRPGEGKLTADIQVWNDPRAEWAQIFREAWRFQRDYFYVPNVHGNDWTKIWEMYSPLVPYVAHRSDLSHLLRLLGGEVSVGHSFVFGGDEPEVKEVPLGLLGADIAEENGRFKVTKLYDGESWNPGLDGPLTIPGAQVAVGEYILQVNGVDVRGGNFYRYFEGTTGKQTVLRVNSRPVLEGSRTVTVVPVSAAQDGALRTASWVEGNRRFVDSASGGKLAYVWLPNTGGEGYVNFNRYYFAQQNRPGAIIDERFNGGGSVADYFIDIMRRNVWGFFNNPVGERKSWTSPAAGIWGPKVMLVNESAGSGGDMLPYMFKSGKLGTIVGTRTWGGLVGIWDVPPLIDGGLMTAPRGGFYNLNGEWDVENIGITPDIEVEQTPKEMAAGRDPQLERAVAEAMKQLAVWKSPLKGEPKPPVRALRP